MSVHVGNALIITMLIAYGVLFVFYLSMEKRNTGSGETFRTATAFKLTLSGLFCLVGAVALAMRYNSHIQKLYLVTLFLVFFGLVSAIFGDYYLQYIRLDVKKFKRGIGFFSLTQILFIVSLVMTYALKYREFLWLLVLVLAGFLGMVLAVMKKQNWKLGPEKKRITAYTLLLSLTASGAVVAVVRELTVQSYTAGMLLFMAGALFFLASDVVLGIWNYNTGKRAHANLNWVLYFSGQMLIALSISPAFSSPMVF